MAHHCRRLFGSTYHFFFVVLLLSHHCGRLFVCFVFFFLFCFCRTIVGGFFVLPFVDPKLCEDKVALKKALR